VPKIQFGKRRKNRAQAYACALFLGGIMPTYLKVLIFCAALFLLYASVVMMIPYFRYFDIKDKLKEAAKNAMSETDANIARTLAEKALDNRIPIVGDYFYQIQDEKGNKMVLIPETEEQQKEYIEGAIQYFLQNIQRDDNFNIAIEYTVELYFPFYTHKINFSYKETQPLAR
jgi:hypothetical protein